MISLFVGRVPNGSLYTLLVHGDDWLTDYKQDDIVLESGRMIRSDEKELIDNELGTLIATSILLDVLGEGKCSIKIGGTRNSNDSFRFYRKKILSDFKSYQSILSYGGPK